MIRINIYRHMDKTAVQIHLMRPDLGTKARPHPVEYLYWELFDGPAHDETGALIEMLEEALRTLEQRSCELGGWSVLL